MSAVLSTDLGHYVHNEVDSFGQKEVADNGRQEMKGEAYPSVFGTRLSAPPMWY